MYQARHTRRIWRALTIAATNVGALIINPNSKLPGMLPPTPKSVQPKRVPVYEVASRQYLSSSQTNVFGGATGRAGWPTVPAAAQHSFVDLQVDRNIVSERDGNGGYQQQGSEDCTFDELPRSVLERQNGSCDAEAQTARDALPVREAKVLAHCMCGVCYTP